MLHILPLNVKTDINPLRVSDINTMSKNEKLNGSCRIFLICSNKRLISTIRRPPRRLTEQGSEFSKFICLSVFIDTGVLFDTRKNELVSMSGIVISGIVTFKLYCKTITYEEACTKFSNSERSEECIATTRTTHMEPCIKFSSFFGHSKFFLPTFQKKIRIKIENFSVFELQPYKKIDSAKTGFANILESVYNL
ncbi:hypothetical protein AGLY_002975 [Aphis glycines]|uniref:Uncharacterized protein n=1 Tax=Aphis glycines TaxID=307491 RepID=A0A6G0U1W5_APHGL|nr:hypothetical protein AGLY_002975 [Aphis glycines]